MPAMTATIPPLFFEIAGVAGFGLYVLNYSLLSLGRLSSNSKLYFAINLVAASLVLTGLTQSFNLAAALLQSFWIVMSLTALLLRRSPAQRTSPAT